MKKFGLTFGKKNRQAMLDALSTLEIDDFQFRSFGEASLELIIRCEAEKLFTLGIAFADNRSGYNKYSDGLATASNSIS